MSELSEQKMEDEVIPEITNCPTCGAHVRVLGRTTKYFDPIDKYFIQDLKKELSDFAEEIRKLQEEINHERTRPLDYNDSRRQKS